MLGISRLKLLNTSELRLEASLRVLLRSERASVPDLGQTTLGSRAILGEMRSVLLQNSECLRVFPAISRFHRRGRAINCLMGPIIIGMNYFWQLF